MTQTRIREMLPSETSLFVRWLYDHRNVNLVDIEVFRRNQVKIYVAESEDKIVTFIPIKAVYWFEALAPNPESNSAELAQAFAAMNKFIQDRAAAENVGKVYVQPSDSKFSQFIQNHFGYVPVTRETLEFNFNEVVQEPAKCAL